VNPHNNYNTLWIHVYVSVLTAENYTAVYTGVGGFLATALVAGIVFATLR
jgi:hypothetical protein